MKTKAAGIRCFFSLWFKICSLGLGTKVYEHFYGKSPLTRSRNTKYNANKNCIFWEKERKKSNKQKILGSHYRALCASILLYWNFTLNPCLLISYIHGNEKGQKKESYNWYLNPGWLTMAALVTLWKRYFLKKGSKNRRFS